MTRRAVADSARPARLAPQPVRARARARPLGDDQPVRPAGEARSGRGARLDPGARHAQAPPAAVARIRIQWYDGSAWQSLGTSGDTGYKHVGHGRGTFQGGTTFTFDPPAAGQQLILRGVVNVQWRAGKKVRGRAQLPTESGHANPKNPAPADVAGDLPDQPLTNSRGSLEMIAGDAEAFQLRDPRGIVDGPDVELAAGLLHDADRPAVDDGVVGHHRVDLARRQPRDDALCEPPPVLVRRRAARAAASAGSTAGCGASSAPTSRAARPAPARGRPAATPPPSWRSACGRSGRARAARRAPRARSRPA